jgi:parallel beta-helix repeat protein
MLENVCMDNLNGIQLGTSHNNTIFDNNCSNRNNGIHLDSSNNSMVFGNDCSNNGDYGLYLKSSNHTDVSSNNCSNNDIGIYLNSAVNNSLWENIFSENLQYQAECTNADENEWDNGIVGNYWSDYTARHPDAVNNGVIWNIPYKINGTLDTYDEFPLYKKRIDDNVAPQWDPLPEDLTFESGPGLSYDLNATDFYPVIYNVNDSAFSIDANGLLRNQTSLIVGEYNLQLNASDGFNHNVTTIIITVLENTGPIWNEQPANQTVYLPQSFYYDASASDNLAIDQYWINLEGTFQIDSNGIITNITDLYATTYNLIIHVNDTSGNEISASIKVEVLEDWEPPLWVEIPESQTIIVGESFRYDVNATDNVAIDQYWINLEQFQIDENGVITNSTKLYAGSYKLQISVNDTKGLKRSIIIEVLVKEKETPAPEIPGFHPSLILAFILIGIASVFAKFLKSKKEQN